MISTIKAEVRCAFVQLVSSTIRNELTNRLNYQVYFHLETTTGVVEWERVGTEFPHLFLVWFRFFFL